jgi:peptide/nickel transport system ATP-binding protein
MSGTAPLLVVDGLTVTLSSGIPIVEDLSLDLGHGEIQGVVGESGSGKSTLALALLGFTRPGARIAAGEVTIAGNSLQGRSEQDLRRLRGQLVSYVPQDPAASLNPGRRIGDQIEDRIRYSPKADRQHLMARALERAQLVTDEGLLDRYPHQLSGGQQQRVLIAMAVVGEPRLIVLDEPTTGLDVVTQARFLREILRLRDELGAALVYVTHDIAAVATVADLIAVMYAGRIVERGPAKRVLQEPTHPYTVGLVESVPDHTAHLRLNGLPGVALGVGEWPVGCPFAPRCPQVTSRCEEQMPATEECAPRHTVRCFEWRHTPRLKRGSSQVERHIGSEGGVLTVDGLRATYRGRDEEVIAAAGVSFGVARGECVALVGESGSGKTTIARCLAGLHAPTEGTITLHGSQLPEFARDRTRDARRQLQIVFQNPYESLNPRHTVGFAIGRAAVVLGGRSRREATVDALVALERVRLPRRLAERFPGELSGGERQRVAIARALVANPDIVICDEVTSSLDVSVQGAVLALLDELRVELGLAMLFITHDLGVVASIADRILVLNHGKICESGPVRTVLAHPADEYTRNLVAAAPHLEFPLDGPDAGSSPPTVPG